MFQRSALMWCVVAVVTTCGQAKADIVLWGDEEATVNSSHQNVILYDTSRAFVVSHAKVSYLRAWDSSTVNISGGVVTTLEAHDTSTVDMSGGNVGSSLWAYNSSTVEMSNGTVNSLAAYNSGTVNMSGGTATYGLSARDTGTVNMSGGDVNRFFAYNSGTVNMSGGTATYLHAHDSSTVNMSGGVAAVLEAHDASTVTLNVKDFRLGLGLTLAGERLLGTGTLSGEWTDGTPRWAMNIGASDLGASIFISQVPEPGTLAMLTTGAISLLAYAWRRRGRAR